LEAGLGWITKLNKGDFLGRAALLKIKEAGLKRKLIGFAVEGRLIPRHGYSLEKEGKTVGTVTSGCYSPILEKNIGLAYLRTDLCEIGNRFNILARGKAIPAEVVKTPFV